MTCLKLDPPSPTSLQNQPVFCGGEFYFNRDQVGNIKLFVNRQSGTVAGCWNANVDLTGLFQNFTRLPTEEYPDSFIDRNSLIPSFFEDYDYLMNLNNLGLDIKFYKEKEEKEDNQGISITENRKEAVRNYNPYDSPR